MFCIDEIGRVISEWKRFFFKIMDNIGITVGIDINTYGSFNFIFFTTKIKNNHKLKLSFLCSLVKRAIGFFKTTFLPDISGVFVAFIGAAMR